MRSPTSKRSHEPENPQRTSVLVGSLLTLLAIGFGSAVAGPVVTSTQHHDLGFNVSYPIHEHRGDSGSQGEICILAPPGTPYGYAYDIGVDGNLSAHLDMGTDVTFSYDKANLTPGGTLPLNVTYTPTGGNIHISAPVTFSASGTVKICILPDLSGSIAVPCSFDIGPTNFTPPLTGDVPVTVPVTSCTVSLDIAGIVNVGNAHVEGSVTMSPVPAGGLALGGAISGYRVASGPAGTSGIPLVEWDNAGETKAANIALNSSLPASADITVSMGPMVHWVATSADLKLVIVLGDVFHDFGISDPSPISLFAGNLGPVFTAVGLDTEVSDAVKAAVGFDPGFGAAIAAGKLPVPLTSPELQSISPSVLPVLGSADFTFNTDVTPASTIATLNPLPTAFGWNNTSVDVTLTAADTPGGSGVKSITFSATGAQPIAPTTAPGAVTVVHVTTPGITVVHFHSTDNQDNLETDQSVTVRIDEIAPAIAINQPTASNYTHSSTLTLDYLVTDAGGSGLNTVTPTMDGATTLAGHGLLSGQAIPLLTELALGSHTFAIAADDRAANASNVSVTFTIVVTPASIKEDVSQLLSSGDIKKSQIKNSLLAKLNCGADAIARGNCNAAGGCYQAFINEVNAQVGKALDPTAAGILIADAQYLIDHCATLIAAATLGGPLGNGGGANGPGLTGGTGGGVGSPIEAGSGGAIDENASGGSTLFGGRSPALVAWPSPYRDGNLSIAYAADGAGRARAGGDILIYDLAGRLVRGLSSTPYMQGYRIATWDGRDAQGSRVPGGMYFIRTGSPGEERLLRLAVVR